MIQGCRKQVERKEGYELRLVKAMLLQENEVFLVSF